MFSRSQFAFLKPWLIPLGIFALALAVRVPALDTFDTVDEHIWVYRSQSFIGGLLFPDYTCPPAAWGRKFPTAGLGCTLQIGYPGVTTMWGGGLGLLAYYWQTVRPTGVDLRTFLNSPDLLRPGPDCADAPAAGSGGRPFRPAVLLAGAATARRKGGLGRGAAGSPQPVSHRPLAGAPPGRLDRQLHGPLAAAHGRLLAAGLEAGAGCSSRPSSPGSPF